MLTPCPENHVDGKGDHDLTLEDTTDRFFKVIVPRGRKPNLLLIARHIGQSCRLIESDVRCTGMVLIDSDIDASSAKKTLSLSDDSIIQTLSLKVINLAMLLCKINLCRFL